MDKNSLPHMSRNLNRGALQIAGLYLLLGSLWILFSDQIAARVARTADMLAQISLYKGWGYVLVTALLLYGLIHHHTRRIRQSEEGYQLLAKNITDVIWVLDLETSRFRYLSPSVEQLLGYTPQEVLAGGLVDAFTGKSARYLEKVLPERIKEFREGAHRTYIDEVEQPRKDGTTVWTETTTRFALNPENGHLEVYGVSRDISERKQAQEELRLWADAFEGCAHGIAVGNADTNRIVVCNPAFARLHKCRVEDIAGSSILSLYAPSDHDHVRRNAQKADQIGHSRFEARMIRRDGSTFPVQMDLVSVINEEGELLYRVATAQDISERHMAERVLQESEERYRRVSELTSDYAYKDRFENGRIVPEWVTESFTRITGYTLEEAQAPDFWQKLVHPGDLPQLSAHMQTVLSGKSDTREMRVITKEGNVRWLRDFSNPIWDEANECIVALYGAVQDITDYKRAEEQILHQARLLAQVNDAVIASDENFVMTSWNPAAERIYGWKAEEVVGQKAEAILRTEFLGKSRSEVVQQLREKGELSAEVTQARKDGSSVQMEVRTVATHDEQGNVTGYVSVNRDITERKLTEERIRKNEERYRYLFENNPHPMWVYDRQTLAFLDVNEAALAKYGYSRQEFLNMTLLDIRPPEDAEQLLQNLAEPRQPLQRSEGWRHRLKDGSLIDVEITSHTIDVDGHASALVVAQDITERKQAQEYLRRFELLSEHSRDIILFVDNRDGRILEANKAAIQAYGYSRDDLLALTVHDLRATETRDMTLNQMAQADAGGILFETVHRRKDGTTFPVEVSSQGANIGDVRILISIVRDITERAQAEDALRLKDQLLRLTSEMAKVGGWEFDPQTGHGTWTDEVARIHDLSPDQETSVEIGLNFYVGKSRQEIGQAVREAIEHARPYDLELEMVTAQGNHKWVRTMGLPTAQDGKVVRVQGIFQDITERKQIEKELQSAHDELERKVQERTVALSEANALLQALMDYMPDHIYFKDTQSRFIRNSRSQARLLGLNDPAEAVGQTDFDFFPHAARSYAEEQEVMKTGTPLVDHEEYVVWPDGREMWVSTTKLPLRNAAGETIGIFGISHDITERKRAEQAIRQLNTDLEQQAAKLQAANKELEAFSYSVSHDLRAPLRAIDGYTRILVEDYEAKLDAEGKRICGVISTEARRMGQLIDDLLAFSRLGRREMFSSKIDMNALVTSVFEELMKGRGRERIDFQIAKLPMARGDLALLQQVWVNLLSNAIKFTSKKERASIEVGSKQARDETIYYVRDNGAGFDMEYADKLFGVFQRLHGETEFEGTGVGLAIVQRIIRRHGGRVWAEGEIEAGATFYFALPRKESHHES